MKRPFVLNSFEVIFGLCFNLFERRGGGRRGGRGVSQIFSGVALHVAVEFVIKILEH